MWNAEIFIPNIMIPHLAMELPVSNFSISQVFWSSHYLLVISRGLYEHVFCQTREGTYNLRWFC